MFQLEWLGKIRSIKKKIVKMKKTLFQNVRIIDGNLNIDSNKDLLIDENSILEISEPFQSKTRL